MPRISVHRVLEVVGDFDQTGGASLGLVAWELSVDEQRVIDGWEHAQANDLITPAGTDPLHGEQMWRLTVGGWAARRTGHHDRHLSARPRQPSGASTPSAALP